MVEALSRQLRDAKWQVEPVARSLVDLRPSGDARAMAVQALTDYLRDAKWQVEPVVRALWRLDPEGFHRDLMLSEVAAYVPWPEQSVVIVVGFMPCSTSDANYPQGQGTGHTGVEFPGTGPSVDAVTQLQVPDPPAASRRRALVAVIAGLPAFTTPEVESIVRGAIEDEAPQRTRAKALETLAELLPQVWVSGLRICRTANGTSWWQLERWWIWPPRRRPVPGR